MALYWLTSCDGKVSTKLEANSPQHAYELLARSLHYPSFSAFIAGTGYSVGDFRMAELRAEFAEEETGARQRLARERDGIITSTFRHMLAK